MSAKESLSAVDSDLSLVLDTVKSMEPASQLEGYAVIEGARYAIETYGLESEAGRPVDFQTITLKTREMLDAQELDGDPWKRSDEFNVGVALGIYIARRKDSKPRI